MTDQLKIETIARSRRTSLTAMVACSNAKSKPPAAINESISASPAELLADSDEGEANRDQKERKELTAGKTGNQARVRLAEIFNDDPKDRVTNEEQTSQNTVRLPHPSPHEQEDPEQNHSFEKGFVKLGWMSRRQNSAQNFLHLRLMTHRGDDRLRRSKSRIDLSACNDRDRK